MLQADYVGFAQRGHQSCDGAAAGACFGRYVVKSRPDHVPAVLVANEPKKHLHLRVADLVHGFEDVPHPQLFKPDINIAFDFFCQGLRFDDLAGSLVDPDVLADQARIAALFHCVNPFELVGHLLLHVIFDTLVYF